MLTRVALFALVSASGAAQSVWFQPTLTITPPPRDTHKLATEPVGGRVLLFGGVLATNAGQLNDTWEWDGQAWIQALPSTIPSSRESHILAADGSGGVILFGGYSFTSGLLNDTWRFANGQWQQLSPATSPPARRYHAAASRGQSILMFGGGNSSLSVTFSDTWEWTNGNWVLRASSATPSARYAHEMAYDAARDRVVMFGGADRSGGTELADTWEWDGTDWIQRVSPVSPPSRTGSFMAYVPAPSRTVVYGGVSQGVLMADCWTWDGISWSQVSVGAVNPGPRNAPMAYSPLSGSLLLFGGHTPGTAAGDTWLTHPSGLATFSTFGNGCAGSAGTPTLAASGGDLPHIGQAFDVQLAGLPSLATVAVGVLGFSTTFNNSPLGSYPLPADLGPLGMPGCTQYVADNGTFFLLALTGQVTWTIPIPPLAQLAGVAFHVQGAVFDPQANALGATVTNAGTAHIGS